jgi:hypothetical protein
MKRSGLSAIVAEGDDSATANGTQHLASINLRALDSSTSHLAAVHCRGKTARGAKTEHYRRATAEIGGGHWELVTTGIEGTDLKCEIRRSIRARPFSVTADRLRLDRSRADPYRSATLTGVARHVESSQWTCTVGIFDNITDRPAQSLKLSNRRLSPPHPGYGSASGPRGGLPPCFSGQIGADEIAMRLLVVCHPTTAC